MRFVGPGTSLALILSTGCISAIEGSGNVVSDERDVAPFTQLLVSGELDVDVTIGKSQRVVLHLDDNLIDLVKSETVDGVLEVRQNPDIAFFDTAEQRLTIEVPRLTSFSASGETRARITDVETSRFVVILSGSSELTADGAVTVLDVATSGSTILNASRLESEDADISASGDSILSVFARNSISANLSGSTELTVYGDPKEEAIHTSGDTTVEYR